MQKRPAHIPAPAWKTAQTLLKEAPALWTHDICAGTFISADGSKTDGDYNDDYDEEYDDDEEYYEEDEDYEED